MIKKFLALTAAATFVVSLCSCSQTVDAPSTSDDEEISQIKDGNQNDNGNSKPKDSGTKMDTNHSDGTEMDWSSKFGDFGSDVESSLTFTQKVDCDFSVDDKKWFISKTSDEVIGDMTLTFDEDAMHILFEAASTDSTEDQCQSDVIAWQLIFAIKQGTDVEASCDGLEFKGTGKFEDPSHPISKKKEVYAELCN